MPITPYVPPATLFPSGLSGIWSGVNGLPVYPYLSGQNVTMKKAPAFNTLKNRVASGRVRKTALWPYPIWNFELSYDVIRHRPTLDELFILWEFFGVAQGQFGTWLFVDPSDYTVASSGSPFVFATGDGSTKLFQLTRPINSFIEPVYGAYNPTILDNGAGAGAHTIQPNGVVSFTTAPTAGHSLSWYGNFYFGCEFLEDTLGFDQIVALLWGGKSVKFDSLRP